jgi:hypothetical protein
MKIEVCEQLIVSWLRHVEGCQIVQSNWMPSDCYSIDAEEAELFSLFIEEVKKASVGTDIFKKSTDSQLIRQTEIDVVGARLSAGKVEKIFLIDTAFHREGLGYADNEARIAKKLVRAVGTAQLFFRGISAEIMFVSPFARESVQIKIIEQLKKIETIAKDLYSSITITSLFNDEFAHRVYFPLMNVIDLIRDDNELFARSMQLMNICAKSEEKVLTEHSNDVWTNPKTTKKLSGDNKSVVFGTLRELTNAEKLGDKLLLALQDSSYTQKNFKISKFPVLFPKSQFLKQFKPDDLRRYYRPQIFSFKGVDYLVCSQWIPERIALFNKWREKILSQNNDV